MQQDYCDILNIEYNTCILMLKALNKCGNTLDAAKELGMSERNLWLLREKYNVIRTNKSFYIKPKVKANEKRSINREFA